jgi:hypothetical protein
MFKVTGGFPKKALIHFLMSVSGGNIIVGKYFHKSKQELYFLFSITKIFSYHRSFRKYGTDSILESFKINSSHDTILLQISVCVIESEEHNFMEARLNLVFVFHTTRK